MSWLIFFTSSPERSLSLLRGGLFKRRAGLHIVSAISEVTQPPIATRGFDIGKPAAQRIKQRYSQYPDSIDSPQAITEVCRKLIWRAAHCGHGIEDKFCCCAALAEKCGNHHQQMDQIKMQDKVKHGHAAEDDERVRGLERNSLKVNKQQEGWAQRHQQEIERSRIFCAVQK